MGLRTLRGAFAFNSKLLLIAGAVSMLLLQPVYAIIVAQSASALSGGNVVTPAQLQGWAPYDMRNSGKAAITATQPDADGGDGSLELTLASSIDKAGYRKMTDFGPVTSLSNLSFDWYRSSTSTAAAHLTPAFGVYVADEEGNSWLLKWEGAYNGYTSSAPTDTWTTEDVLNGNFWRIPQTVGGAWVGFSGCNQAGDPYGCFDYTRTLNDEGLSGYRVVGIEVSVGSGWTGSYSSFVDNVEINDASYDFEPLVVAPCTETSAVHSTSLENWDLTQTRSAGSNEIVADGLHVMTTPSEGSYPNEFSKAAGYFATNFPLSQAGSPSITFDSYTGVRPSLQLGVDKDGNGSWDGYLVYEPWAYGEGNFWSSKNFGIASGMGYTSFGTLNDYLAANPNAIVTSIGYSLGSGVVGEAVISEIVAGCVSYTFGLPVTPEEPVVTPPVGGEGQNSNGGESVRVNTASTIQTDAPSVAFTTPQSTPQTPTNTGEADQATDSSSDETSVAGEQNNEKTWSLINVLLAIGTVILSIISVAGLRSGEEDSRIVRLLTIIPAVAAVVAVLVLEDFAGKLGWVNAWTLLFAVIMIAQVALYANSRVNEQ